MNAIKVDPNTKIDWLNKGNELFGLKEYGYAREYYENAIKVDPNN